MINFHPRINVTHYKSWSMLLLHNVQKGDSGNYSCVPSNAHPASIFVHILNGELTIQCGTNDYYGVVHGSSLQNGGNLLMLRMCAVYK